MNSENRFFLFWLDIGIIILSILALLVYWLLKSTGTFSAFLNAAAISYRFIASIAILGLLPVLISALRALFKRRLTIDLLASIALVFALINQEWSSAVFISLMLASARVFASYTANQAKKSIQSLLKLRPQKVHIKDGDIIKEIKVDELKIGDLILVEAGERIPADGIVESGTGTIDQSSLTGESKPLTKQPKDKVWSSTLNIDGSLVIKADKVGEDTTFSKIVKLVEEAQRGKAAIVSFAEHFTNWYILATLIGSLAIYFITHNLLLILSILLVTCADDIAVAIPLGISAAIGAAAKKGIIVKGGNFIEGFSKVKVLVTDKTGTITRGKLQVQNIVIFEKKLKEKFLPYLGAIASVSRHPTAAATLNYLEGKKINIPKIEEINEKPGHGIKGLINKEWIFAGNKKFLIASGVKISAEENNLMEKEKALGRSLTALSEGNDLLGFVSFSDTLKPQTAKIIDELKELGIERIIMLTGDNEKVAAEVAQQAHIKEFKANLLPQDKIKVLKQLLNPSYKVAMVGDGVNDAAALSLADIGVAMGAIGSDAAIESADIILMKDELKDIPILMKLSLYAMKVLHQDILIWALTNIAGLSLVFAGLIGPTGAAAYNFITDFIPLINSMKLFRLHLKK